MSPEREVYQLRPRPVDPTGALRIDYDAELNPAQKEVVMWRTGPVLVAAGAGTGKTRCLVYRVARLVETGVDPSRILLLTFSRRAAREMLTRASSLLDGRCDRVGGGTFHSFGNLVLRRHGNTVGLPPDFTILDQPDSQDALDLMRRELGLDRRNRSFPRKEVLARILGLSVNLQRPVAEVIAENFPHLIEATEEILGLYDAYRAYKEQRHLVDYDDLLERLVLLLREHPEVRQELSRQIHFLMVDEYQDTNGLQAEIVQGLASEHGNVMAVGDDAQGIYSFRGANFRNIMDFPRLFPGTRILAIEENYRSTAPILEVANEVIERAAERYPKRLFTRRADGILPALLATTSENLQSRFVCQRILELQEEGVRLEEMAVLMRAGYHSFDLEMELARHQIPFVKRGGFRFLESAHIKDVLAYARILQNPADALSWRRVLLLLEGIGMRGADEIVRWLEAEPGSHPEQRLRQFPQASTVTVRTTLANLLERLRELERPEAQFDAILRYYEPLLRKKYFDDAPRRFRDLEQVVSIAARYDSLTPLLVDVALEPPTDAVDGAMAEEASGERLVLSTIHSAKGLEWRAVFVIWLAEGYLPSNYAQTMEAIEEERRLLYVAMTRARQELYLTHPMQAYERGHGVRSTRVSSFLEDLPESVLRPLQLVEADEPRLW